MKIVRRLREKLYSKGFFLKSKSKERPIFHITARDGQEVAQSVSPLVCKRLIKHNVRSFKAIFKFPPKKLVQMFNALLFLISSYCFSPFESIMNNLY